MAQADMALFAIGSFVGAHPFPKMVRDFQSIVGIEVHGTSSKLDDHAATIIFGHDGDIHGFRALVLSDEEGEPAPVHTLASGLDYPAVGPEHAHLRKTDRLTCVAADDRKRSKPSTCVRATKGPSLRSKVRMWWPSLCARPERIRVGRSC